MDKSSSIPKEELELIVSNCIKNNYAVFKAFDVADGVINTKEYFEHMRKRREGDSV